MGWSNELWDIPTRSWGGGDNEFRCSEQTSPRRYTHHIETLAPSETTLAPPVADGGWGTKRGLVVEKKFRSTSDYGLGGTSSFLHPAGAITAARIVGCKLPSHTAVSVGKTVSDVRCVNGRWSGVDQAVAMCRSVADAKCTLPQDSVAKTALNEEVFRTATRIFHACGGEVRTLEKSGELQVTSGTTCQLSCSDQVEVRSSERDGDIEKGGIVSRVCLNGQFVADYDFEAYRSQRPFFQIQDVNLFPTCMPVMMAAGVIETEEIKVVECKISFSLGDAFFDSLGDPTCSG